MFTNEKENLALIPHTASLAAHMVVGVTIGGNKDQISSDGAYTFQHRTIIIKRRGGDNIRITLYGDSEEDLTINFSDLIG